MTDASSDLALALEEMDDISDLPRAEWLAALEDVAEEFGYFEPLGTDHAVAFVDQAPRLLVTFEGYEQATERGQNGWPLAVNLAATHGWSSLTLVAHGSTPQAPWYRAREIIGYIDRLVDDGFFEDFDQVVFYGAGAAGYAAAAYSVASPGATVITVAPQATMDSRLTIWDRRFPATRRMDFTTRYGFAPDMVEGAEKAYVFYDPKLEADAMHAALFARPHVARVPLRLFGADPEFELMEMGALTPILTAAMESRLDQRVITRALRARRRHLGYLRRMLEEVATDSRPTQTALLCRHVLRTRKKAPRFKNALMRAEQLLLEKGRSLPGTVSARSDS